MQAKLQQLSQQYCSKDLVYLAFSRFSLTGDGVRLRLIKNLLLGTFGIVSSSSSGSFVSSFVSLFLLLEQTKKLQV